MEGGTVFAFRINSVQIGTDEDGDDVTSAVIEQTEPEKRRPKLSGQAKVAMQALDDAIRIHGQVKSSENYPNVPRIPVSRWRESCDLYGLSDTDDQDNMRRGLNRSVQKLLDKELICIFNKFVWKVNNDDD